MCPRFCSFGRVLHVDHREMKVRPVCIPDIYAELKATKGLSEPQLFLSKTPSDNHHQPLNTTSSFVVLLYTLLPSPARCLLRPPLPHHHDFFWHPLGCRSRSREEGTSHSGTVRCLFRLRRRLREREDLGVGIRIWAL